MDPELTRERRVIRFDLPGFGLTGPAPDGIYTVESYVDTVLGVADTLGVQRFVLAGNSLGGYVAWATAVLRPERVDRLILIDAAGYSYRAQSGAARLRIARTPLRRTCSNARSSRPAVSSNAACATSMATRPR